MFKILYNFFNFFVFDDNGIFFVVWVMIVVIGFYYDFDFMEMVKIIIFDKFVFIDV